MLSSTAIREAMRQGQILIEPAFDLERRLQPASLDVCLGNEFMVFRRHRTHLIDPKVDSAVLTDSVAIPDGGSFVLHPGEFVLGSTQETVTLGTSVVGRVEGKSSLGRLGLLIHSTAGFIDPGFSGQITLEISSVNTMSMLLYPGMPIGQLAFQYVEEPPLEPYRGKYQGQTGPQPSRYHLNWDGHSW